MSSNPRQILLTHKRAPGDTLVLTGFVRDLKRAHPHIEIGVSTSAPDLWKYNPYVKPELAKKVGIETIKMEYGEGIRRQSHESVHFLSWFHRDFHKKTGLHVPVTEPKPDLHFSPAETPRILDGRYWVIVSGGKTDFTAKVWSTAFFQSVVTELTSRGIPVVQAGGSDRDQWHPPLAGVVDMVGRTNLRDLARLLRDADGVICGVTMLMHMAAALERPCVVLAGGREAWWWEAYVNENRGFDSASGKLAIPHRFLHTIGLLPCCEHHGCWKSKVVSINGDRNVCKMPTTVAGQYVPTCMAMIEPAHVVEAVMSYYTDKTLPPIVPLSPTPKTDTALVPRHPRNTERSYTELPAVVAAPTAVAANFTAEAASPANVTVNGHRLAVPVLNVVGPLEGRPDGYKPASPTPTARQRHQHIAVQKGARGPQKRQPLPISRRNVTKSDLSDWSILDHPIIGGRMTFFVLLYGPESHHRMHRQCLEGLIAQVPAERREIRIGSNELNRQSLGFVDRLVAQGVVQRHYRHQTNAFKYPVMREMFHDATNPIQTPYLMWFDDDTICDKDALWLPKLAATIVEHHPKGCRLFGPRFNWHIQPAQMSWIKSATWYRNRQFRDTGGAAAPNGQKIHFATGSFWALATHVIKEADIPDVRLSHNGGDYTIGEQVWQAGYDMKTFNSNKQFVRWSAYKRRGVTTPHPGH